MQAPPWNGPERWSRAQPDGTTSSIAIRDWDPGTRFAVNDLGERFRESIVESEGRRDSLAREGWHRVPLDPRDMTTPAPEREHAEPVLSPAAKRIVGSFHALDRGDNQVLIADLRLDTGLGRAEFDKALRELGGKMVLSEDYAAWRYS